MKVPIPGLPPGEQLLRDLEAGPHDPEAQRREIEAATHEQVDAAPQWAAMSALGVRAYSEGQPHAAEIDRQREDLKPESFTRWKAEHQEEYADNLRQLNDEFEGIASQVEAAYPSGVLPTPVTTVDSVNLNTRVQVLQTASLEQTSRMVDDGIRRGDAPFLSFVQVALRSWPGHRNLWSSAEGHETAEQLLEQIESATFATDAVAGQYASERIQEHRRAWHYLVSLLVDGDGVVDRVHREVGSLAPLLGPED